MLSSVISVIFLFIPVSLNLNTTLISKALGPLEHKNTTITGNVSSPSENLGTSNFLNKIEILSNTSSKTPTAVNATKLLLSSSKSRKFSNKSELIDEYEDDYDDYDGDEEGGYGSENGTSRNSTRRRHKFVIKRVGTTYAWGDWDKKWSKCANSCVQTKRRQCIKRIQNTTDSEGLEIAFYPNPTNQTTGCFGIMKKYRLCKDEKCKLSNRQMRDEQCSNYNRQPFKGKFYTWRGYEKEHNECELYCKPIDSDIFISMNQSVRDGTPCEKPSIYYTHYYRGKAVCVEGICKITDHGNNSASRYNFHTIITIYFFVCPTVHYSDEYLRDL